MSGIVGVLYLDGRTVDMTVLRAMARAAAYRGPDGEGYWASGPVGLGHLRLCTTPESFLEVQPVCSPWGEHVMVWDGRLDNREGLAAELPSLLRARLGRVPQVSRDSTDTELVLAAYAIWGTDCVRHIVGDFAFAIWDGQRRQLFCARDPLGMRLFHYYHDGSRFIFGTETRQVLQHPGVPRAPDELMLGLYLCGNFGDGEMTFYQGIRRLKGGCALVVSGRGLAKEVFWAPDPADQVRYRDEAQYVEHFRALLLEAVRCRLRSASPVGIATSGGLDSGSVAACAGFWRQRQAASVPPLRAYFWTYRDPPLDESPYAEAVAGQYGMPLERVDMDGLWAMKLVSSAAMRDGPFGLHFEAMHQRGLEAARQQGVRVLLTGEGGDEAFLPGAMLYLRDWALGLRLVALWRDYRRATPGYRRDMARYLRRGLVPPRLRRLLGRATVAIPAWLDRDFVARLRLRQHLEAAQAYRYRESPYLQVRGSNPLFIGGDQRAASHGMELRHPFWDSRLVEFLARVPPGVRFQGGRSKLLLRRAMRGIVPAPVLRRAPHGAFGPLLELGFRQREAGRLEQLVQDSCLERLGAINGARCLAVYRAYLAGDDSSFARLFWTFITEEWLRLERPFSAAAEPEGVRAAAR